MERAKPARVARLERLARDFVGDSTTPNLYFVTDRGVVVTITRNRKRAHDEWLDLAIRQPRVECALEDRAYGVISSVEPDSDEPGARLRVIDDYRD